MKSVSQIRDFEQRLGELTSKEDPISIITPYQFNGKPFCGTFDGQSFDLTVNSFWRSMKWISITGTFRANPDGLTDIDVEIGIPKKGKILSTTLILVIFLIANLFLFVNRASFPLSIFVVINCFLVFGVLLNWGISTLTTAIVKERFFTEFEILTESER